jgi:hypothetical protein
VADFVFYPAPLISKNSAHSTRKLGIDKGISITALINTGLKPGMFAHKTADWHVSFLHLAKARRQ